MSEKTFIKKYLKQMGRPEEEVLDPATVKELIQEHAIAYYRGKVSLNEGETCTVRELAEVLAQLEVAFEMAFTQALG